MNSILNKTAPVVGQPYRPVDTARVAVSMESEAVPCLKWHVAQNLIRITWGGRILPGYDLFDLLTIDRLLTDNIANVVMTHAERKLVASYCYRFRALAKEDRDDLMIRVYDEMLAALLEDSTHITFQLWT